MWFIKGPATLCSKQLYRNYFIFLMGQPIENKNLHRKIKISSFLLIYIYFWSVKHGGWIKSNVSYGSITCDFLINNFHFPHRLKKNTNYTLLYIKQITTRTYCLAEGTNYTQYFVITYKQKESEKNRYISTLNGITLLYP